MKKSNKPERTCCGCRGVFNKDQLFRIVRTPEGTAALDLRGKADGRGAYLCKNRACLNSAKKTKRIAGVLKVQIPEKVFADIEKELENYAV